tara:strand:+ start:803 stop:1018 length:216 start_codon:yes stop_codon:yes gene_type:complete
MNKEVRFMVTLITSEKITSDDDINEMSQNIADAIVSHANTAGITPEVTDGFTEIVYVKGWYQDKEVIEHVR